MNKVLSILIVFSIFSCNDRGCNSSSVASTFEPVGKGVDMKAVLANRADLLPNTCTIVPLEYVARELELQTEDIKVTDSSPRNENPTHSSCFFKWSNHDLSNAGILFQALRNPVGDEYPNYVEMYIESKLSTGEQGIDEKPIIFQSLEGLGDAGAYSTEAGKYFWRLGNEIIFSIAFNTTHTPEQQKRIAQNLGALLTQNYIDGK